MAKWERAPGMYRYPASFLSFLMKESVMSKKVMKLIDPYTGRMRCKVCRSEHYANLRPLRQGGGYYRGSWQCVHGCRLPGIKS